MKLGTLILGLVGNLLKIRGNLDRTFGSWEGEGDFSIWPPFRLKRIYENEAKLS